MNQLALFEMLPPSVGRAAQPAPKRRAAAREARGAWAVGMLVRLPISSSIQGERWRQYTMGLRGRVEWIEGDLAGVRVVSTGHKFDGKVATAHQRGLSVNN